MPSPKETKERLTFKMVLICGASHQVMVFVHKFEETKFLGCLDRTHLNFFETHNGILRFVVIGRTLSSF